MKRILTVLLAALLCVSFAACVAEQDTPTTEPTEQTTGTLDLELPTDPTVEATEPTADSTAPSVSGQVTPPEDMPGRPDNDYSLPGDERPGDRDEVIDK